LYDSKKPEYFKKDAKLTAVNQLNLNYLHPIIYNIYLSFVVSDPVNPVPVFVNGVSSGMVTHKGRQTPGFCLANTQVIPQLLFLMPQLLLQNTQVCIKSQVFIFKTPSFYF
jgi:hypothetical protein